MNNTIHEIIGKTVVKVTPEDELIKFEFDDGSIAEWYHEQDCCESVVVDDIVGDWEDLTGSPLLVAEVRSNENDVEFGHETWTFYTLRTIKGSVDVKWHGESNGYYSEEVSFKLTPPSVK